MGSSPAKRAIFSKTTSPRRCVAGDRQHHEPEALWQPNRSGAALDGGFPTDGFKLTLFLQIESFWSKMTESRAVSSAG
ncbi:hypothetical protein ABFB09_07865 [Dehalogenimonas sp. THU2]|uniref:hypothetical protein n=1 Tax=Dehalogenimonas sp. THU2 TaxID=3151121 RepID=UPI00321856DA